MIVKKHSKVDNTSQSSSEVGFNNILYFYPFVLRGLDIEWILDRKPSRPAGFLGPRLMYQSKESGDDYIFVPSFRANIPFLEYTSERAIDDKLILKIDRSKQLELPVQLNVSIHIWDGGPGALTIELDLLDSSDQFPILNNETLKLIVNSCRLGDVMKTQTNSDVFLSNNTLYSIYETTIRALRDSLKVTNIIWIEQDALPSLVPDAWLRARGHSIDLRLGAPSSETLKTQYPFPICTIDLRSDKFDSILVKSPSEEDSRYILQLILQTTRLPNMRIARQWQLLTNTTPTNLSAVQHWFVNFGYKGAVIIRRLPEKDITHETELTLLEADKFETSANEAFELIIIRRHLQALADVWLDKRISEKNVFLQYLEDQLEKKDWASVWDDLINMIQKRAQDKTFLMMLLTDPILARMSSASYNAIYDQATKLFRFSEMDRLVQAKLSILDRLYDEMLDYTRLYITSKIQLRHSEGPKIR